MEAYNESPGQDGRLQRTMLFSNFSAGVGLPHSYISAIILDDPDIYEKPTHASTHHQLPAWPHIAELAATSGPPAIRAALRVHFRKEMGDPNILFVGHPGKSQLGLDLYGYDSENHKRTGVQCKNYTSPLTKTDIDKILKAVDGRWNEFGIQHLIIALPIPGNAKTQAYAASLSTERAEAGLYTLSLSYVADIDHQRCLLDALEIARRFPELHYGHGEEWLQSHSPLHVAYAEILEIGKRAPIKEGHHVVYDAFINGSLLDEIDPNPFSAGTHRKTRETIAIPIDGVHPRRFWVSTYCRTRSSYFKECNRSVDICGFELECSSAEHLHEIYSLMPGHSYNDLSGNSKYNFMIGSGILQASLLKVRKALRSAGVIRMVVPTCETSDVLRNFLLEDGFTEARNSDVLVDAP